MRIDTNRLHNLTLVGISHRKSPVEVREKYCLTETEMIQLYKSAKAIGLNSIFAVSTCNRTEIYALDENANKLTELLLEIKFPGITNSQNFTSAMQELENHIYIIKMHTAALHMFQMCSGLDAQVIGDVQITGQIRRFHQLALKNNALDFSLSRLIENAICTAKAIKSQKQYNSSTASVAYAAVCTAGKKMQRKDFRSLVIGAGSTGKLLLKNLLKISTSENITLINRTDANARYEARIAGVNYEKYSKLKQQINLADVIITATASPDYIITDKLVRGMNLTGKLFIDTSMPRNISPSIQADLINISQLNDDTRDQKHTEFSLQAQKLIDTGISEYEAWLHRYELAQSIKTSFSECIFSNDGEEADAETTSKFIDGITFNYLRNYQREKRLRNLAA